jgi:hypothetical protein
MIWNSFLLDRKHKWLSYNLWFFYIQFYKVVFFFSFSINKNFKILNYFYIKKILYSKKKKFKLDSITPRFSYYIDLYFLEFLNQLILLNLYFFTNLKFYKKENNLKKKWLKNQFINYVEVNSSNGQLLTNDLSKKSHFLYNTFF